MKISIAMATYNGAEYLDAQLNSLVTQTRLPDELVVTDDCSTDSTLEILERFAKSAPFSVLIHRNANNLGYCGNFNQALLRTQGDLVFISDQDDVWFPEKIERMVSFAARHPQALVMMNDAVLTHADLSESGLTKLGQIRSAGFKESSFVMGCCAAVRRDLLDLCLPIPEGFGAHDSWVVGIADGLGRKRIFPVALQYYRRHEQNESQWIVNRTTRVTRWSVRVDRWKRSLARQRSLRTESRKRESLESSPEWLLRQWAKQTLTSVPAAYAADLRRYYEQLDLKLKTKARRVAIRSLPFAARPSAVRKLWMDGEYAVHSGWKLALRDLIGKKLT